MKAQVAAYLLNVPKIQIAKTSVSAMAQKVVMLKQGFVFMEKSPAPTLRPFATKTSTNV
jgi:hypothetical protein